MKEQNIQENNKYKIDIIKTSETIQQKETERIKKVEQVNEKETLSTKEALLVFVMLIIMYSMISAIPTFVMMFFFDISFWISQIVVIIGTALVVWIFGLYKPATKEQKLKKKFLL